MRALVRVLFFGNIARFVIASLLICDYCKAWGTDKPDSSHDPYLRRVLILDFHGQQTLKELTYLQISIPEAFVGPLQKTNIFEIQSRDLAAPFNEARTDNTTAITDAEAIKVGKLTQSEVVVFGNFVVVKDKLLIQAKAIDVMSGRVSVSDSIQTPINAALFDNINLLAQNMSSAMAKKLPPLAIRALFDDIPTDNKSETQANHHSHVVFGSFGLPFTSNLFNSSGTLSVPDNIPLNKFSGFNLGLAYWNSGLLPRGFMAGAEFTYSSTVGTATVLGSGDVVLKANETFSLRMLQTEILVGYSLVRFLPWRWTHFNIMAIAGLGAGHLTLSDTGSQSVMNGIYGLVPVGIMSIYELGRIQLALGYRTGLIFLPDSHMHLGHRIDVKVGYRL